MTCFHTRISTAAALCVLAAFSSGCLAATTLITVKPDASGTIDQTIQMTPAAAAQIQQMMAMGQASGGTKPPDLFSEAEMRKAAAGLGDGVTFVSSQRIKNADGEGIKALYAFTDIRKLRISQGPNTAGTAMPGIDTSTRRDNLTFGFNSSPGGNSVVSIVFPSGAEGRQNAPDSGRSQLPPEALAMARQMFKGFRIDIGMQVAGRIVKTNSSYVEGSKVTLLAVDFEQLMADPTIFADLQRSPSVDTVRSRLAGIKGVKIPPANQVTIEFTQQ